MRPRRSRLPRYYSNYSTTQVRALGKLIYSGRSVYGYVDRLRVFF